MNEAVLAGLREQHVALGAELQGGARRIGWKIGLNAPPVQEALGIDEEVIGHLTSGTLLEPGATYRSDEPKQLLAEAEVALEIGPDGQIASYAPAIELADIDLPFEDVQAILAGNVFHRAVLFGDSRPDLPDDVTATVTVDGEEKGSAPARVHEFARLVELTSRLLEETGEHLEPGDRIISGSITPPVPVAAGERVVADLGALGRLEVAVS